MRPAWARGANYDRSLLKFYVSEPGFILGEGVLGVTRLGGDGSAVLLDADFTSCTISSPCTVESGLFVSRETETCTLTATLPEALDLDGKRLTVSYDGITAFKGTVREADWSEAVDVGRPHLPGNTATKTYRVQLVATSGEDAFAQAATPPRSFSNTTDANRLASWLGASPVAATIPAADLDGGLLDNVRAPVAFRRVIAPGDQMGRLLDEIRDQLQLTNLHYRYEPWASTVTVKTNSRWLAGTTEATALRFTDNPASDTMAGGDPYLHNDRTVSYSERTVGTDSGMFVRGVTVSVTDLADVTTEYGPFRASNAFAEDVSLDLGKNALASPQLARAWVATLPLRTRAERFTKTLRLPVQSRKQIGIDGAGPGMALLEADGTTERIAVLSVVHSITPTRWMAEYTCGPEHLISRKSDLDPYIPQGAAIIQSGANLEVSWLTPRLPGRRPLYWFIASCATPTDPATALPLASWINDPAFQTYASGTVGAEVEGDPKLSVFTKPGTNGAYTFALYYTSSPVQGDGLVDLSQLQGQPAFLNITVV